MINYRTIGFSIVIIIIVSIPIDYLQAFGHVIICMAEGFDYVIGPTLVRLHYACYGEIQNNELLHFAGGGLAALAAGISFLFFKYIKPYKPAIIASFALLLGNLTDALIQTFGFQWWMHSFPLQIAVYYSTAGFFLLAIPLFSKIEKDENTNWLTPSIASVVAGAIFISILLYGYFENLETSVEQNDFPNWITLIVEIAFGIIITLIVYDRSKKSENIVTIKLKRISGMVEAQFQFDKENRNQRIKTVLSGLKQILELSKKCFDKAKEWEKETDSQTREIQEAYILANHNKLKETAEQFVTDPSILSNDAFKSDEIGMLKLAATVSTQEPKFKPEDNKCEIPSYTYAIQYFPEVIEGLENKIHPSKHKLIP